MKAVVVLFVSMVAALAAAGAERSPSIPPGVTACGTSVETQQAVDDLQRFVRLRNQFRPASASPRAEQYSRFADDVLFMRADQDTVPFDDPADLEGLTLGFARRSHSTFAVTREPLQYDQDLGQLFISFQRNEMAKTLTLDEFVFPFGDEQYAQLTLSVARGIHFTDKPSIRTAGYDAIELITDDLPLIAPLYDYLGSPSGRPDIFVKRAPTFVVITWKSQPGGHVTYDVQAVLYESGDMRFSYRKVQNVGWGGVVVMTGDDAWKIDRTIMATVEDPMGDVAPSFGEIRDMLDIVSIEASRVANSSLLEFRIRLVAPIDRAMLPSGTSYLFFVGDSMNRIELMFFPDRVQYRVPVLGDRPALARIHGTDVILQVAEDVLALPSQRIRLWAYTSATAPADSVIADVDLGQPGAPLETDFSELTSLETERPILETYRLGAVNVGRVWDRLRLEFGYDDEEIDAVAIYTSFLSDIILSPYGAFATLSNPGANGVSPYSSRNAPRSTTLMHMNSTMAFTADQRTQVLLHELGHRWLYYFRTMEDGRPTSSTNPRGFHPAQWVHTPVAFPVRAPYDSSAMGGATFTPIGGGSFRSSDVSAYGFSWHELYLMGLAAVEEVQPWWYLTGTSLGDEYYPPPNEIVTGTPIDLGIQQIIAAMGPRDPAFGRSQTSFRVLFVVLEHEWNPASSFPSERRVALEQAFRAATGGRGAVDTRASTLVPDAQFTNAAISGGMTFTDRSTNHPLRWEWSFGDGGTSTSRNPIYVYGSPGVYPVTLTVTNARGSDSITKEVIVAHGTKRRAAGK